MLVFEYGLAKSINDVTVFLLFLLNESVLNEVPGFFYFQVLLIRVGQFVDLLVEDALKYVKREVRRGNKYQGIILDPPAYGRGADGEKWVLDQNINEMVEQCSHLLDTENSFFLLNMYSIGFSALVADNLVNSYFKTFKSKEMGELYLSDKNAKRLPLGTFLRFTT